jgi:NAD-dependent dihydropyrimidine dehydrogenase PreA subunit
MIEFVSETRCIQCNKCVQICPMNVFSAVKSAPPIIARQDDCQTCFMCELYCPVDALYVSPDTTGATQISERTVEAAGLLGTYRETGWATVAGGNRAMDQSFRLTSGT